MYIDTIIQGTSLKQCLFDSSPTNNEITTDDLFNSVIKETVNMRPGVRSACANCCKHSPTFANNFEWNQLCAANVGEH